MVIGIIDTRQTSGTDRSGVESSAASVRCKVCCSATPFRNGRHMQECGRTETGTASDKAQRLFLGWLGDSGHIQAWERMMVLCQHSRTIKWNKTKNIEHHECIFTPKELHATQMILRTLVRNNLKLIFLSLSISFYI